MSKNKNNKEESNKSFAEQVAPPASVQVEAPAAAKKGRLGAWGIVGISAAGLALLAGTATAGGLAGAAIANQEGHDRNAVAQQFEGGFGGREHGERGERGEHQRGGDRDDMMRGEGGQMWGGQQGQTQQSDPNAQTEQGQMQGRQMPHMDTKSGAS